MTKNPILDELHAVRERLLEDAGGTLDALGDWFQAKEKQSNHPRLKSRRTIRCTGEAKSDEIELENQSSPPRDR